ncbi:MAG: excinuclease ABC subunit UvrA [Candidatus Marinimicrobia bacterium]|nr:excinuclease ABC subunit UvrA [Candidatus Neomarinimicrobiota bacterium]
MLQKNIVIRGAREHNLKNIDVEIPRDKLVIITGLSGSGKSSLAFDTLYAEGQRRYVESLSAYARQFLGVMEKPDVDKIEGLSPAISIEQKTTHRNPRSTVATITEIHDYMRLLFARIGKPHCFICGKPISKMTVQEIVDRVMDLPEDSRIQILAPAFRERKGEFREFFNQLKKEGFLRIRLDGKIQMLSEIETPERNNKHNIDIIIDRLIVKPDVRQRLTESIELALQNGNGNVIIYESPEKEYNYSENFICPDHPQVSLEELSPRMFSFNNPIGACPACNGLGYQMEFSPDLVVPDKSKSLLEGALKPLGEQPRGTYYSSLLKGMAKKYNFRFTTPWYMLSKEVQELLLYGSGHDTFMIDYEGSHFSGHYTTGWEGVIPNLERRFQQTTSNRIRSWIEKFISQQTCRVCGGSRLKRIATSVYINEQSIDDLERMSIREALEFISNLELNTSESLIAEQIVKEMRQRLVFLNNVGLDYLTLNRSAGTLSGGEAQRIRLATQIGSQLMGVMYILDEPSIGLHQRDNQKLLETLKNLRDLGNTIIVIEHDQETMEEADWIIDMGPGAGIHGGDIVCAGDPERIKNCGDSLTGLYLSGKRSIEIPEIRRKGKGKYLRLFGAEGNNLKKVDLEIPLGTMTCVSGVSGSGKSTLINETLVEILNRDLMQARGTPLKYEHIEGKQYLDKIISINQAPIGRTPRSNPATYTGVFTLIRDLYASLNESKQRGYSPGRFSFNVKGGRCEACTGDGVKKIEMHFLSDVYVTCEVCKGKRYNRETLEIRYRGKNIADILEMTVEETMEFFKNHPKICNKLKTLFDVGLGYIHLGQQATTLSGGEAQRVKLATELSRIGTGKTLYVLDEPTTGLHFADVHMLLDVLNKLVNKGNTVLIIEHNLDVIKNADWVIDLGPEGGDRGGTLVVCGTPEQVAAHKRSYTGQYLKKVLKAKRLLSS